MKIEPQKALGFVVLEIEEMKKCAMFCLPLLALMGLLSFNPTLVSAARVSLPLSRLTPAATADLRGAKAHFGIKVPIPNRWGVTSSTLELKVVSSVALLQERSLMSVRLNGHPLGQVRLGSDPGAQRLSLEVPAALLEPGYNDLELIAMHRSTEACQDRGDPELWSTVELDQSFLTLAYQLKPIPESLRSIPGMVFDPKNMNEGRVHLILEDFSPQTLKEACLAACAAALRYDYRPVHLSVGTDLRKGVDTIAIGSQDFLQDKLLDSQVRVQGNLGLMHLPEVRTLEDNGPVRKEVAFDETHVLISVQGQDHQERLQAARALCVLDRPWPGDAFLNVSEVGIPDIRWFSGQNRLKPDMETSFEHLGLKTTTFQGMQPEPGELRFKLPSQAALHESRFFTLGMDLAYGGQMRADSVLNVVVNDRFAAAIPLRDQQGARYEDYKLQLPVSLLKAGQNTVSFEPVLTPLITGECTLIQEGNLRLTLEGDSTLELPELSRWAVLPELRLLFQDGFPLTASPDWKETAVFLPKPTPGSVSAVLELIGLISQKNGIAPFGISFVTDLDQAQEKHVLALGRIADLPDQLVQTARLDETLSFPFPSRPATITWKEFSWWRAGLQELFGSRPAREREPVQKAPPSSHVAAKHSLPRNALLVSEFASPLAEKRTVVMIAARTDADLMEGVSMLVDPGVSSKVEHDLALVDFDHAEPRVYAHQVQDAYSYGQQSPVPLFQDLLLGSLWTFIGVCVLVLAVLALILTALLRGRRKKRLSHV